MTLNINKHQDQLTCNRRRAELLEQPPQPGAKVTAARGYTQKNKDQEGRFIAPCGLTAVQVESPAPSSPRRERGAADGSWVDEFRGNVKL